MKTNYFLKRMALGISFLFLVSTALYAQTDITVGTGTTTNQHLPIEPFYGYTYSQQIYLASEISTSGTITHLKFYFSGTSLSVSNNWTIYIGTTSNTSFSNTTSWIPVSSLTQVYSSTFTSPTTSGWLVFDITDFVYNGTDNIVVAVDENTPSYNGGSDDFYCTFKTTGRSIYYYNDNTNPDPASPPSGYLSSYISNIKFTMAPVPNDLAMDTWISPNASTIITPNASVPITVKIVNSGTVAQSGFPVKYSIDAGTTIVTETCSSSIASGDTLSYTFATTADMSSEGVYECGAVVSLSGDAYPFNDTVFATLNVFNPLAGTYTIGAGATDDYSTINDAVNDLYTKGISAPVIFNIASGTYNEQVEFIGAINGASPSNTVTFKGQGQNTVVHAVTSYSKRDVFYFENASYITLDSLNLTTSTSYNYNYGVRINTSDSITVKNTIITVPINTSSYSGGIVVSGSRTSSYTTTLANYLVFDNNNINGGYYGIKLYGNSYNHSSNINIKNNTINDFHYYGIYSNYQDFIDIESNVITSNPYTYGYGIYLYHNLSIDKIANNNIILNTTSAGYGIYLSYSQGSSSTNPMMVYNNMISIPTATGACRGIYSYGTSNANYYYNSINIEIGSSTSQAFYFGGSATTIEVKDNIFINKGMGYAIYFSNSVPSVCDYNDLISNGSFLARNGYVDIVDLAAWKNSTNTPGAHSVSIDPGFVSSTDLHASSYPLKSKGSPIPMVPYDIDGDIRNVSTPDMGADEFTPEPNDVYLSEIVPTGSCGLSSAEYIQVVVKNYGSAAQTNVPIKLVVDGGAVITELKSSLAVNAIDTFTFSTSVDLSAAGAHNIMAYADLATDANNNNDTAYYDLENVLAISSFPYLQDFESPVNDLSANIGVNADAKLSTRAANGGTYGLMLTGKTSTGWYYNTPTLEQAFQDNYTHVAEVYACNVDASSLAYLSFDFDMKINTTYNYKYVWFRVLINDSVYAKDVYGDSAWQAPASGNAMAFQNLAFHLNEYAGTNFKLSFEASCKYDSLTYSSNHPWGDEVMIDNIHLYEPLANDLSVTLLVNPISGICESSSAVTQVVVENKGAASQNNVPITAIITTPSGDVTITANSGLLPAFGIDTITLGNVDISQFAVYNVVSYADFAADQDHSNDTLHTSFEIYTPYAVDYIESFEGSPLYWGAGPSGWYVGNDHGKTGRGVYKNFNTSNTEGDLYMTRKIGPIPTDAVLTFDYRILDYYNFPNTGTILHKDTITYLISNDCGASYIPIYVVDSFNHTPTSDWTHVQVDLSAYVGQNVIIKEEVKYDAGNYYVDVDDFGIGVPPPVDLGPDTAICIGVPITLDAGSATSAYPYIWTYGLGSNADTIAYTQTISPDSAGIYVVKIREAILENYDTIVITTNPLPTVSGADYDTICNHDSTLVEFTFTGTSPWNFTVNANGGTFNDNSSTALTQRYVSPTATTLYKVVSITDGNGCVSTGNLDSMEVYVNPLPTVTFSTSLSDLCASDPAYTLSGGLPTNGIYSGNGVSTGVFSATSAGAGSHIITYTYTDANGCSDSATQTQLVNALPVVGMTTLSDLCADAADLTLTGGTPANGTYSGTGVSGGVFSATTAGAGSHTVTYSYTDGNGCTDSASQTQVVNALPIVSFATLADVCASEPDFSLSGGSPLNGTYSGTGVNSGTFSANTAGVGTHTLTYTYTDGNGCTDMATQSQVVNALPIVTFTTALADLCADAPTYTLSGGLPVNGTYSGTGVSSGSFAATTAGAGLHTITYTFSDANGCTDSATQTQLVNALPTVSLATLSDLCADAADLTLTGGSPANGTYSGTGVSGGVFSATTAGVGSHTVTYSYTDGNGCSDSASQTQVVNALPVVSFATLADVCASEPDFSLSGGSPLNGTYSGTGVSSGTFSANTAGVGTHTLTYTYTDGNGCTDMATQSQVVNSVPTVTFTTALADLCADAPTYTLSGGLPVNGTYSGTGVSSGSFAATTAGAGLHTITYTFSDANGCTDSATQTQLVNALPTVSMATLSDLCADAADLTLTGGTPVNGTYSGTGVSGGIFSATTAGVGSHTVTYSFTDGNGCSDSASQTQVVNALPMVSFATLADVCANNSDFTLSGGTPINGVYSGTGVSGGSFSPTTAGVGSYTLTYAYTDGNGCSDSATQMQVVNSVPTVTFTTTLADLCADAPTYTLSGGLPLNGIYSGTGVSSGSFAATTAGAGLHTITYTFSDANGCTDSATQTQLVNALPTVSMTALSDICADAADFTLSGGTPVNGTYSGTGVSGGMFSAATSGVGSYYITYSYTDANSCTNLDSVVQTVNALPIVTFTGLAATYCTNSLDDTLIANPMGGTFVGAGMTADVFSASTAGAGSFDITYSYTDGNGCSSSDTNSTVVFNAPQVDLGSDTTLCAIDSTLLDAGASMVSYVWNTGASSQSIYAASSDFGIGTFTYAVLITDANNCFASDSVDITFEALPVSQLFDTATICGEGESLTLDAGANPLYGYLWSTGATTNAIVVDTAAIGGASNYVSVTLTSPAGCTTNDSSYVYFREVPMPFIGNDSTICWNHQFVLDAGSGYTSYLWSTGATTQTITLDSLSFIIGSNDYSVEVVNAVNCANSDTMTLVVDPCTGIYTQELTNEDIRVYPNPSKGRFQIDITGLENEDYSIEIFNSMGSKVAGKNLDSNGKSSQSWDVDISTYAKGIYFVRLQSVGKIKVKRIIIQ